MSVLHHLITIFWCNILCTNAYVNSIIGHSRLESIISKRNDKTYPVKYHKDCISFRKGFVIWSASADSNYEYSKDDGIGANDGEALESLFFKFCDTQGLLKKDQLRKIPFIKQLLEDSDLLEDELDAIWNSAPKFPLVADNVTEEKERIDVDSFIQIYRDIDDLFEDDDSKDEEKLSQASNLQVIENNLISSKKNDSENNESDESNIFLRTEEERALESTFGTLCDEAGLLSKQCLEGWDEIKKLYEESLLSQVEFDELWERTPKSPGSLERVDIEGFLSFNVALDDMYDFEEEDANEDDDNENKTLVVVPENISPEKIFFLLSKNSQSITLKELKRWDELSQMLQSGDLLESELNNIFSQVPKMKGTTDKLDQQGFIAFWNSIDQLFEPLQDSDEKAQDEYINKQIQSKDTQTDLKKASSSVKPKLMQILHQMNTLEDCLPCGIESTPQEQKQLLTLINSLEKEPTNKIKQTQITSNDVIGEWNLLYTSSTMVKYNKGLSGLGKSFPNGKFESLKQVLSQSISNFLVDVKYIERINVDAPKNSSFDVTIDGDWRLKNSTSLFTGEPCVLLTVEPNTVKYLTTSTRADHWKSVRSMNVLDITYLDDSLRVMRGNTNEDTIFIFESCG